MMNFSQDTMKFLIENRLNNSKEWYNENKAKYNDFVISPLVSLVEKLTPYMLEIDNEFITTPKVDKTISRIYRDTRFSKDKSLYRDVMWCVFLRSKKLFEGYPGFFFEFSPEGFRYGCGYYQASSDSMDSIRQLIDNKDKDFLLGLKTFKAQNIFGIEGDSYKKSKYSGTDEDIKQWYDRKAISFIHNSKDFELLFSDKLADKVGSELLLLKDIYKFLWKAEMLSKSK